MEFIKKHKFKLIGLAIFLIIIIIAIIVTLKLLYPNTNRSVYGNRLDGIEKIPINQTEKDKLVTEFKKNKQINNVTIDVQGRLINIFIDVTKSVDLVTSKSFADKTLTYFTEQQKGAYDIQVYITCESDEKSDLYPIIGYKHKTSMNFKWTNK